MGAEGFGTPCAQARYLMLLCMAREKNVADDCQATLGSNMWPDSLPQTQAKHQESPIDCDGTHRQKSKK